MRKCSVDKETKPSKVEHTSIGGEDSHVNNTLNNTVIAKNDESSKYNSQQNSTRKTERAFFTLLSNELQKSFKLPAEKCNDLADQIKLEYAGQIIAISSKERAELRSLQQLVLQEKKKICLSAN